MHSKKKKKKIACLSQSHILLSDKRIQSTFREGAHNQELFFFYILYYFKEGFSLDN